MCIRDSSNVWSEYVHTQVTFIFLSPEGVVRPQLTIYKKIKKTVIKFENYRTETQITKYRLNYYTNTSILHTTNNVTNRVYKQLVNRIH